MGRNTQREHLKLFEEAIKDDVMDKSINDPPIFYSTKQGWVEYETCL